MPSLITSLGIDRLSPHEKIQLVQEIWGSIASSAEQLPLTDAQRQELERRLAALQSNPSNVIPWEEVEARAFARFRK
jgi:putative addiction module component (TIGR02574 family)